MYFCPKNRGNNAMSGLMEHRLEVSTGLGCHSKPVPAWPLNRSAFLTQIRTVSTDLYRETSINLNRFAPLSAADVIRPNSHQQSAHQQQSCCNTLHKNLQQKHKPISDHTMVIS